jgi:hypothetical protein
MTSSYNNFKYIIETINLWANIISYKDEKVRVDKAKLIKNFLYIALRQTKIDKLIYKWKVIILVDK